MVTRAARKLSRLPPEDRIAEIMVAARAVLAGKGYENFLPADVAARCGVSEATVYRYFPTKRDLLVRVAEDWFGELLSVEPEVEQQHDVFQQLRHVIRHSLAVVRKEPSLTRFVLLELRADPTYRSMHIYMLNRRFTSTVSNVIKEAVLKGIFRTDVSPTLARDMIFGCIEHQTWPYLRGQGDFSVDAVADGITNIIFQGLAAAPARDRDRLGAALGRIEAGAKALNDEVKTLKGALGVTATQPHPTPDRER